MRKLQLSMIGLIVLLPLAQVRGDDEAELTTIINKAVQAAGGLEVLEKLQKQKGKEEGTFHGGEEAMPFTATFASDVPNNFRMEVVGVFTIVLNGDKAWVRAGGATQPLDERQLKEQQEEQQIGWVLSLVPLVKQGDLFKLARIDGKTVDDRETVGLKVQREGHRDVAMFFDAESYDLIKAEYKMKAPERGYEEVDQEVIFKEFKDVQGARMATEVVILRDGRKYLEATLSDIEPVDEFPDETFAEPK